MGQEEFYPVKARKSDVIIRHGTMTGGGGGQTPTLPANVLSNYIKTVARTGVGAYTITFDRSYPDLRSPSLDLITGTNAFLHAKFSGVNVGPTAGGVGAGTPIAAVTATITTDIAGVATDMGLADILYITMVVRNSGRNK